jgi:hypothetical protein
MISAPSVRLTYAIPSREGRLSDIDPFALVIHSNNH